MSESFDIALQLGIKALDAAERLRRTALDGQRSVGNKATGGPFTFQIKQWEADDRYGTDVVELAIRVVTTCMFNRQVGVASQLTVDGDSQNLIPTTASMEAFVKRLRLDRVIDKENSWDVPTRHHGSISFDAACDELMGLHTPELSSSSSPETTLDVELKEASEFKDVYGRHPCYYGDESENLKANYTPSTPDNRKRHTRHNSSTWIQTVRNDSIDVAEAESPSTLSVTNATSLDSELMRVHLPRGAQRISSNEYSMCSGEIRESQMFHVQTGDDDINTLASASAKITLQPKRKSLSPQPKFRPNSTLSYTDGLTCKEELKSIYIMDEISDILLRICFQLDNLASRKPNFYGVFNMHPIAAELEMLKRRLLSCLEFITLESSEQTSRLYKKQGRNAPLLEGEDFPMFANDRHVEGGASPYRSTPARSSLLKCLSFRDVTGRIFWEDHCCDGDVFLLSIPWSRFVEAFESVYGPQPQSVMERFRDVFDRDSSKNAPKDKATHIWVEQDDCCFSSLDSSAVGKNSIFRLSPLRKKRRSHVTRWFRKNIMQCPTLLATDKNSDCETCVDSHEDQTSVRGHEYEMHTSTVVHVEAFAKFCTDYGGLFEGFVSVSDPGTHVECLGTVEDLSKEELHNLGLLEENDELVPDGEADEKSFIFKPCIIKELLGLQILQLSCGGQHAAVLVEGGDVYTWGKGGFGRLGHGDTRPCSSPRKVVVSHRCSQVACGFAYTAFVTQCGAVYSFGAGENGRLGVGDEHDRNRPTKVLVRSNLKIDSVYAGSVHTCILTTGGEVYSFGKHEYTGHGSFGDVFVPKKLDTFGTERISQLSVGPGGYHTIALTSDTRRVYTWGHNRVGQLGFPISENVASHEDGCYFVPRPTWVKSVSHLKVSKVVAGWGHSALVTEDGAIFTCGRNFQGQLGSGQPDFSTVNERGHPYQCCFRPVKGELANVKISQLACGGEHSIALSEDGHSCFSFGKGHKGQLGLSSCETRYVPTLITRYEQDRRQILEVACGNNCSLVLMGRYKVPSLFELCREAIVSRMNSSSHDELPPLVRSILSMQNEMDCSND